MLQAKETAELHNLLGDVDERAGDRIAAAASYQRAAHLDADRGSPLRLGQQPAAAARVRRCRRRLHRRHPPASHVGATPDRARHRAVFARPAGRRRDGVLPGRRPGAVRSATLRVPRRDVRRVAGSERGDHPAPRAVRRAAADERGGPVLPGDEPVARGGGRRVGGRSGPRRGAAAEGGGPRRQVTRNPGCSSASCCPSSAAGGRRSPSSAPP